MKKISLSILFLLLVISAAGCMKTYTYQAERKDQDIRGNRGVIMGKVPQPEIGRRRTRTMAAVDIQLPASKEYKTRKKVLTEEPIPQGPVMRKVDIEEEPAARVKEPAARVKEVKKPMPKEMPSKEYSSEIEYTVQKGDTLQKISEKFYGTTRKWPEIYEANRDVIKDSSKIHPGQVIVIPQFGGEEIK